MGNERLTRRLRPAAAALLMATLTGPIQAVDFSAPRLWPVGTNPVSIAVADFNGDGKLDMAVSDETDSQISVLLNNGDGTFQPTITFAGMYGTDFGAIAAGDFNGDGKPDLAVVSGDGPLTILLGNGDGTFRMWATPWVLRPTALVVGDFNGDGKLDIALTSYPHYVGILLGNGNGTFQEEAFYTSGGTNPMSVTAGDFNGDGRLDLAIANYDSNNISVLLGNGDGAFGPPASFAVESNPDSVAVGDFNGDGKPDLVVANYSSNNVSVLLGNGDGSFQPQIASAAGNKPKSVAVEDFNGDGKLDLAVASGNITVLLGNGDGTLGSPASYIGATGEISIAVADFNGDAKPELAAAVSLFYYAPGYVVVLASDARGGFPEPVTYPLQKSPSGMATADFDGDGIPDLAAVNTKSYNISILKGNGNGTFQPETTIPMPGIPTWLAVGDFNGDGKPDLAVTVVGPDESTRVSILLGNGDGTFQPYVHYAAGQLPEFVLVADFNGDGKPDLAVTDYDGAAILIFLGKGDGTFQPAAAYAVGETPLFEAVGDFNGDGTPDLIVTSENDSIYILLGNPDGTLQPPVKFVTGSYNSYDTSAAVGDFNGDGRLDLAVVSGVCLYCDAAVSILLGNGDGTFQPPVDYDAGGASPVSVAVADFNGDGRPDLAIANASFQWGTEKNDVAVLLGNGDGTFQAPVSFLVGDKPTSLIVGDFNRDGKPDVAVSDNSGATVLTNTTPSRGLISNLPKL